MGPLNFHEFYGSLTQELTSPKSYNTQFLMHVQKITAKQALNDGKSMKIGPHESK